MSWLASAHHAMPAAVRGRFYSFARTGSTLRAQASATSYWNAANLRVRLGWSSPSVISTLLTLQASGLVCLTSTTGINGGTWSTLESVGKHVDLSTYMVELTDFGLLILQRAEHANAHEP